MSELSKHIMENCRLQREPIYFTPVIYDELLEICGTNNASDITVQTNQEVFAEIHGKMYRVNTRKLTSQEVTDLANYIYGPNASALIASGKDIDTNHVIKKDNKINKAYL